MINLALEDIGLGHANATVPVRIERPQDHGFEVETLKCEKSVVKWCKLISTNEID